MTCLSHGYKNEQLKFKRAQDDESQRTRFIQVFSKKKVDFTIFYIKIYSFFYKKICS